MSLFKVITPSKVCFLRILAFIDASSLDFPVIVDCGTITAHLPPTANELSKCSVNAISYKSGFCFEPCEYGGFIIPTVACFNCNLLGSCFKKSSFIRLLFPSPRKIILVVAIVNIFGRNSIPCN